MTAFNTDIMPDGKCKNCRRFVHACNESGCGQRQKPYFRGESHQCHFCGTHILRGWEHNGERHYLSDCRPDLVQHEIGELCTWHGMPERSQPDDCYAYQNRDTNKWGDEHIHFYNDGPM